MQSFYIRFNYEPFEEARGADGIEYTGTIDQVLDDMIENLEDQYMQEEDPPPTRGEQIGNYWVATNGDLVAVFARSSDDLTEILLLAKTIYSKTSDTFELFRNAAIILSA